MPPQQPGYYPAPPMYPMAPQAAAAAQ
jgi:hypothetical protein